MEFSSLALQGLAAGSRYFEFIFLSETLFNQKKDLVEKGNFFEERLEGFVKCILNNLSKACSNIKRLYAKSFHIGTVFEVETTYSYGVAYVTLFHSCTYVFNQKGAKYVSSR